MQVRSSAILLPIAGSVLILLYLIANSIPYFGYDSACFYYEAVRLANGELPFLQFVDNKNPGIIFFQLIPAILFGSDPSAAVFLARLTEVGITVCLLSLLRHFHIAKEPSILAIVAFWTSYIALFAGTNETFYTETLEVFCVLLAWCAVVIFKARATAGFLLGCAILSRQTALLGLISLLLFDVTLSWSTGILLKDIIARLLRTAGACVMTIAAVVCCAAYQGWLVGWWHYAYEWSWLYMNRFGSPEVRLLKTLSHLFTNDFTIWWGVAFLVWCPVALADFVRLRPAYLPHHLFILLGFGFGLLETSLSGILLRHHFIPWLPALAIMLGFVCQRLLTWAEGYNARWMPILLTGVFPGLLIPITVSNMTALYGRARFNQDRALSEYVGQWIQARTGVDQVIYVWGFAPQLYLSSERRAGSKHFHHLLITNVRELYTPRNDNLIQDFRNDIQSSRPKIILDMEPPAIDGYLGELIGMYSRKTLSTPFGSVRYLELRTSGESH